MRNYEDLHTEGNSFESIAISPKKCQDVSWCNKPNGHFFDSTHDPFAGTHAQISTDGKVLEQAWEHEEEPQERGPYDDFHRIPDGIYELVDGLAVAKANAGVLLEKHFSKLKKPLLPSEFWKVRQAEIEDAHRD